MYGAVRGGPGGIEQLGCLSSKYFGNRTTNINLIPKNSFE